MSVPLSLLLFIAVILSAYSLGSRITRLSLQESPIPLVRWPLSVFTGLFLQLFLLNILLYFIEFHTAAWVTCVLGFLAWLHRCQPQQRPTAEPSWTKKQRQLFAAVSALWVIALLAVHSGTYKYDANYHEAWSLSLQNGNFPMKWPWYPDYYMAYHHGYDLLLAYVQELTGLSSLNSHRPVYVVLSFGLWCLLFGMVFRYTNRFHVAFWGLLFFFCLSPTAIWDTLRMALSFPQHTGDTGSLVQYASRVFRLKEFDLPAFLGQSMHHAVLMKYPIAFSLIFLFLEYSASRVRSLPWFGILFVPILCYLALCDEPLFGLLCLSTAYLIWRSDRTAIDRGRQARHLFVLFGITAVIVVFQGGLVTAKLFYADRLTPAGSPLEGGTSLRLAGLDHLVHVASSFNFILSAVLAAVVSVVPVSRLARDYSTDFRRFWMLLALVLLGGLCAVLALTLGSYEKNLVRAFNVPLIGLMIGSLAGWVLPFVRRNIQKPLPVVMVVFFCTSSFVWILAGTVLSARYFFSQERSNKERELEFAQWYRRQTNPHGISFGVNPGFSPLEPGTYVIDARYTGRFTFGGSPWRDPDMIADYEDYVRARKKVEPEFLRTHKIAYVVCPAGVDSANAHVLSDSTLFEEIADNPYRDYKRVFKVLSAGSPSP